eukprot:INCI1895.1.p1 GENE.INCI1895.1~~INCI1895.1.p1  ORF type:complete len:121 (-),score=10.06 INCI1895.1:317-679(-)
MAVVAHFKPYSNMRDCGKIVVAIWSSFAALFLAFFGLAFKYNSKYTLGKKLDPESCSSAAFIASAMYAVIATISISMCCKQTCRAWQYARQIHPRRYWSMKGTLLRHLADRRCKCMACRG